MTNLGQKRKNKIPISTKSSPNSTNSEFKEISIKFKNVNRSYLLDNYL